MLLGLVLLIRARTPGNVVLTGASTLTFSAPHVTVDGPYLKQGALDSNARQVVRFGADHGRLTNSAAVDYNPPKPANCYWVYFSGNHNRLALTADDVGRVWMKGRRSERAQQ